MTLFGAAGIRDVMQTSVHLQTYQNEFGHTKKNPTSNSIASPPPGRNLRSLRVRLSDPDIVVRKGSLYQKVPVIVVQHELMSTAEAMHMAVHLHN